MLNRFMPTSIRIALSTVRQDARSLARALREPRLRGARTREIVPAAQEMSSRPSPPSRSAATSEALEAVIVFGDSGVEVVTRPGQTILEAGREHGVDLLFSCTLGGCGACMVQIVEGQVDYEDRDAICLTDEEIEEGCCLACVGRPRGRVVLEA